MNLGGTELDCGGVHGLEPPEQQGACGWGVSAMQRLLPFETTELGDRYRPIPLKNSLADACRGDHEAGA